MRLSTQQPAFVDHVRALASIPKRITLKEEKMRLSEALEALGCELVGEGAFGSTFLSRTHAIKIVLSKESQGYLAYARFCRANHATNKLLPRIDSIHEVGRYTLVRMEKLHENPALSSGMCRPLKRASRNREHVNQASGLIGRRARSLAQVMDKLSSILEKRHISFWDIRVENIMFRKERGQMKVVLTDPIAY